MAIPPSETFGAFTAAFSPRAPRQSAEFDAGTLAAYLAAQTAAARQALAPFPTGDQVMPTQQ